MNRVGRNEPCPCGSGKKFKRCCWGTSTIAADPADTLPGRTVPAVALDFLYSRYRRRVEEELRDGFFGSFEADDFEALAELPEDLGQQVDMNAHDWLLAEAIFEIRGQPIAVSDLLLGTGAPSWTRVEREWLAAIGVSNVGLLEIASIDPGRGVAMRDVLDRRRRPVPVLDHLSSLSAVEGDLLGVRLLTHGGETRLAGSVYSFRRIDLSELVSSIRRTTRDVPRRTKAFERLVGRSVRDLWLADILAAAPSRRRLPEIVDRSTGERLLFVTDHFDVLDEGALESCLVAAADVEGDREEGWNRFEAVEGFSIDERRRELARLELTRGKRLSVETRTLGKADAARAWLERVAGGSVRFRIREQSDPWALAERAPKASTQRDPAHPAEASAELMAQLHVQIYRNWSNEPIPLLGSKTPKQAVTTPRGRREVEDLIRGYEVEEAHRARADGRAPSTFNFLRAQVGLPTRARGAGSA